MLVIHIDGPLQAESAPVVVKWCASRAEAEELSAQLQKGGAGLGAVARGACCEPQICPQLSL